MASFYKRGDGQWEARVRKHGFPPQRHTFATKLAAEAWAIDIEFKMNGGTFLEAKTARGMLLIEVMGRYKREVCPKMKNSLSQIQMVDRLCERFGHYALTSLKPEVICDFRDELKAQGKGASTINHYLNTLSAIYTAAEKEFHIRIPFNPARSVSRVTPPAPRRQRITDEMIDALVDANRKSNAVRVALGGTEPVGEFEAWLRFALETCMRRGEIDKIMWSDVDMKARTVHLHDTKNGEDRIVPLSQKAIEILKGLKRKPKQERVFNLTAEGFKSAFRRAKEDSIKTLPVIAGIRFHDTRREATSRMAKKLPNIIELAAVTGHKKLDMLKIYYRPDPTELAKKLDA